MVQKDNLIEEQAQLEQPEIETAQADKPAKKKPGRKPRPKPEKKVKVERNEIYHEFAKKTDKKGIGGRETKYDPVLTPKLAESYAMEGCTDTEICDKLGIGETTFYVWRNKHEEFREALKRGKEPVNADIKASMLKTAFGYFVEETETTTTYDPQTREMTSVRKTVKKRYIAPNATMQLFLAKNRMPEQFKDVYKRDAEKDDSGAGLSIADLIAEDALESASEVVRDGEQQGDVRAEDQD